MKKIIINADDFGISHEINKMIAELIIKKKISSTSILTKRDKEACAEALEFARDYQNSISFGLHLDLSEYFKFDELGFWGRDEEHINPEYRKIFSSNQDMILEDIESQFKAFKKYEVEISHIDGHHHIHLFPEILKKVVPIMKKYNVNKMRFIDEFYLSQERLDEIKEYLKINEIIISDNFIAGVPENENDYLIDGLNEAMIHASFGTADGKTEKERLIQKNCFSDAELINYNLI